MVTIQSQNFGVEIEMTGVSRGTAASVIANYFGVGGIHFAGGTYQTYEAKDSKGRLELVQLPDKLDEAHEMDATNWFLNHHYLKSYNSPYDCTGQEFTNWFYLFRRRGHWFAYHSVSRDV